MPQGYTTVSATCSWAHPGVTLNLDRAEQQRASDIDTFRVLAKGRGRATATIAFSDGTNATTHYFVVPSFRGQVRFKGFSHPLTSSALACERCAYFNMSRGRATATVAFSDGTAASAHYFVVPSFLGQVSFTGAPCPPPISLLACEQCACCQVLRGRTTKTIAFSGGTIATAHYFVVFFSWPGVSRSLSVRCSACKQRAYFKILL
jgi:hypothetical protein